jgi:hypothetical protein
MAMWALALAACALVASAAHAQVVIVGQPTYPPPTTVITRSYYSLPSVPPASTVTYSSPAPVVTYSSPPVVTYSSPPVVTYSSPVVTYSSPAPVVTYAAPAPGYYATRSYYGFGIFRPRGWTTESYYYP